MLSWCVCVLPCHNLFSSHTVQTINCLPTFSQKHSFRKFHSRDEDDCQSGDSNLAHILSPPNFVLNLNDRHPNNVAQVTNWLNLEARLDVRLLFFCCRAKLVGQPLFPAKACSESGFRPTADDDAWVN